MKKKWTYMLIFFALITACKKESNTSPVILSFFPSQGSAGTSIQIHGIRFDSVVSEIVVSFNGATVVPDYVSGDTLIGATAPLGSTTGKITVMVNGKSTTSANDFTILQDKWLELLPQPPLASARYWGVGFSIGDKGYLGMGWDLTNVNDDLYEYDPSTNSWTQKSSMGTALDLGVSFVINGRAYVGIGKTDFPNYTNSFYEYDPAIDKWTQKADFPGQGRYSPVGIAIGNKGYVGLGGGAMNDWWEYDPTSNSWTRKNDLPIGGTPINATGFAINNYGYVIGNFVTGPVSFQAGVLKYDASSDSWTRKNDFPGGTISETVGVGSTDKGFLIGNRGYWIYDAASDSWDEKGLNNPRGGGAAFNIAGKLYYGIGLNFWVDTP